MSQKDKYRKFVEENLEQENTVKLSSLRELDQCSEEVQKALNSFYLSDNPNIQKIGSMLNAIYTQQTKTFMVSIRILRELIKEDPNIVFKDCHSSQYKNIMAKVLGSDMFTKLREPRGNAAGLYELTSKIFLEILEIEVGKDVLEAKKEAHVDWYDTTNQEREENFNQAKKNIEERRRQRKRIENEFWRP